jgi:glutathionyl-hydroquinone reductase
MTDNKGDTEEQSITFDLHVPGRYRLYASRICPFAHRVRLVRLLQEEVEDAMEITFATEQTKENGYIFDPPEPDFQATTLKEVYGKCANGYSGKFSVPLVTDRTTKRMIHNESIDIAIALSSSSLLPPGAKDLAKDLAKEITLLPYKYVLATDSSQKEVIASQLWTLFDKYEALLGSQSYILGDKITLPDCILWISLIRYDNIYARMFGGVLSTKTITREYPNLANFVQRIWNRPCAKNATRTLGDDVEMSEVVRLYWQSHHIAPLAGHDPSSPPPETLLPVF